MSPQIGHFLHVHLDALGFNIGGMLYAQLPSSLAHRSQTPHASTARPKDGLAACFCTEARSCRLPPKVTVARPILGRTTIQASPSTIPAASVTPYFTCHSVCTLVVRSTRLHKRGPRLLNQQPSHQSLALLCSALIDRWSD